MRVALIQINAGPDKADNIRRALGMTREAIQKGARFILLPEIFNWRGDTRDQSALLAAAEHIPGPSVRPFMELARAHKSFVLLGSILESSRGDKVYNTSIFINSHGETAAKYRKIHLFDARIGDKIIREADRFIAGKRTAMAQADMFQVGLSICYDVRFADLYRTYGRKGATVFAVPACFTRTTGEAHWETLLRARAIEQLSYVLAPAQVGQDARGIESYGNSMIVSPWGEILARGSRDKEEIIMSDISADSVRQARRTLPGIVPSQ